MVVNGVALRLRHLLGDQMGTRLFGPGLISLVVKVAGAALSYAMLVAFARMMAPDDFGQFGQMLNLSVVLAAAAGFGLPTAVLRYWPGHVAKGEFPLAKGFVRDAQLLLLAGALVLIIAGLLADAGRTDVNTLGLKWGWLTVALLAAVFAFGDYYSSALRAQGQTAWSLVPRDIVWRIVAPAAAGFWFWHSGALDAGAAIAACIAIMALVAVAQYLVSARETERILGSASAERDWKTWRGPLLPLWGASLLYAMVQQLDVVVVGTLVGPTEAGAYFAAQKTASLLGLVMIAAGLVAAPLMAGAYQAGRKDELQRICRMIGLAIAVTTLLGFCVLALIGAPLLAIFDPTYDAAYPILMVLALGYSIDALAGPSAYLMQMTSLEGPYLRLMAIVYAFVLALQFFLVPKYGVLAAASASAAGVCLWNVIAIRLLRSRIGIDPSILSFISPPKAAVQ